MNIVRFTGMCALALVSTVANVEVGARSLSDDPPVVVSAVAPFYPTIAASAHALGKVVVEVTIDREGTVTDAKAVSGHPLLQKSCEKTAKRWRFVAATDSTNLRRARLTFVFTFRSDGPEPPSVERDLIIFTPPYQVEWSRYEVIKQAQFGQQA